ncbi:hypothetical protein Q3G72_002693 [Acer saccharum]|nr:hypothetical protein Q3G72_002693 [Acer saccharum]
MIHHILDNCYWVDVEAAHVDPPKHLGVTLLFLKNASTLAITKEVVKLSYLMEAIRILLALKLLVLSLSDSKIFILSFMGLSLQLMERRRWMILLVFICLFSFSCGRDYGTEKMDDIVGVYLLQVSQNKRGRKVKMQSMLMPLIEFDHMEKVDALYDKLNIDVSLYLKEKERKEKEKKEKEKKKEIEIGFKREYL